MTPTSNIPRMRLHDLRVASMLFVLLPFAWCLPESRLDAAARALARLRFAIKRDAASRASHIAAVAGDGSLAWTPRRCAETYCANVLLERMYLLRWFRPGSWRPRIDLVGAERLDRAVAAGRGVFLWTVPFAFSTLVTRMGLGGAGYRLHLLSRYHHNFSVSRWGARWLNLLRRRQEAPYLAERLVIWPGNERETVSRLIARLEEGAIVSTNVGETGRRTATVPFLAGRLTVATGPAAIALRMGAPLIPVFSAREPSGGFTVTVEAPLAPRDWDDMPATIEAILARYAALLECHVLRHPDQFHWHEVLPREVDAREGARRHPHGRP